MKRQSAANILKYIKLLDVTDNFLDDIYVVCPCYKTENKSTIDFQASISGSPYYLGGPRFTKKIEPKFDAMRREVKEETYLSLYDRDLHNKIVRNNDLCFLTDTELLYFTEYTKLCVDNQNIEIYGKWAKTHGIDLMTSAEIMDMEDKVYEYRENHQFNNIFIHHKISLVILGELNSLLDFYTKDIFTIEPPPHNDIPSNDFGVLLVPLRLVDILCHKKSIYYENFINMIDPKL